MRDPKKSINLDISAKAEITADGTEALDVIFTNPIKRIGHTISLLYDSIVKDFENGLELKVIENNLMHEQAKQIIYDKCKKIPTEKVIKPQLHIIGPIINDLRFYYLEEEYVEMFANLIANSLNSDYESNIHPSFIQIIQGISSIDAKILNNLITRDRYQAFHVTPVFSDKKMSHTRMFGAFIDFDTILNPYSVLLGFNNLERLGLIEYENQAYSSDIHELATSYSMYTFYRDNIIIQDKINEFETEFNTKLRFFEGGWVKLTKLGTEFVKVCLKDS